MNQFLILLTLIIIPSLVDAKDVYKKVEADLNQDKKIDRIETYKNDVLITVERSTNFSGRFDETILYYNYTSSREPVEIQKLDTNSDGKVDKIVTSYEDRDLGLLVYTTEVDADFDGKFEKKWTSHTKLKQEANCIIGFGLENSPLLSLDKDLKKVRYSLDNGYVKTGWGYNIHQSCLDKWGARKFPALLKETMQKGLQCFSRLAEENKLENPKLPNGAYQNLKNLQYLLKTKPVTLTCAEKKYDWEGTLGNASTSPADKIESLNIIHPYVSLNPNPKTKSEEGQLAGTIFHEQLHNLGYRHGKDIEYPYACEVCCIMKDEGENTANACKICRGAYNGTSDKRYVLDTIAFGKSSYNLKIASKAVLEYQKEFPKDRFGIFAYAYASSGVFDPVGMELGKILKEKIVNRTKEEDALLDKSLEYQDDKTLKAVSPYSKLAAQVHYLIYFEQDKTAAMALLEKEKEKIKNLLRLKANVKIDEENYVYTSIIKKLDDDLSSMSFSKNPQDADVSNKAYKMLKDTKLI